MAARWLDAASQQVELLSSRLSDLWSAALGLLTAEVGPVPKDEVGPAWAVLLASFVGLLALAACGGLLGGRRRPLGIRGAAKDCREASTGKGDGAEEQRRKNRRRTAAKRAQMNGSTVLEPQEHLSVAGELSKKAPQAKTEKGKKNKKKATVEVNARQRVSSSEGKEPEEGRWETKISNREKRQQRRKDKEYSSEPEHPDGTETPVAMVVEHFNTMEPVRLKKSRGDDPCDKLGKEDAGVSQFPANWSKVHSQNGGDCTDTAMKFPSHIDSSHGDKGSNVMKTTTHRNLEPSTWELVTEGTCSHADERMKTGLQSVSFPGLRLSTPGVRCMTQPALPKQWDREDYEWNNLYEMAAADPGSDWNTPTELWGNCEQPQVENLASWRELAPMANKVSMEDKEKSDPTNVGSGKSKKKKKKRKTEDAGVAQQDPEEPIKVDLAKVDQSMRAATEKVHPPSPAVTEKRAEPPTVKPKKLSEKVAATTQAPQSYMASLPLKESGDQFDPPKQVQKKKKARRET